MLNFAWEALSRLNQDGIDSASWLNQVEIWFNRITQQAIRRGTFSSVKELVAKIDYYVQNSNRHAQPFVWTATAGSIFAKVERLCERIYGTAH
jgi:hypothetical protein